MKITDIIIMLLFIIPGYISMEICIWLTAHNKSKKMELKELARIIFWSCPIVFVSGFIFSRWFHVFQLPNIIKYLNHISYLMGFSVIVTIVSIIFGILGGIIKEPWFTWINWIRKNKLKKYTINLTASNWEEFFGTGYGAHYLEIIKDGKVIAKGFDKSFSFSDEGRELILDIPETWKDYPDIESKFTKINQTYVELDKSIIVNDYDLTEYKKFVQELWDKEKQSNQQPKS
jgi:hypothetical protein